MGNRGIYIIFLFVLFAMPAISGCSAEIEKPEGTISVSDLLENPVYDKEVVVYGKVDIVGKVLSPYFELGSGGKTIKVWYNMMIENNGTPRKPVKAEGISNGSWVFVTGELKKEGKYRALNDFWASRIEKLEE